MFFKSKTWQKECGNTISTAKTGFSDIGCAKHQDGVEDVTDSPQR